MSTTLEEKLSGPVQTSPGTRPRATLEQLRQRRGFVLSSGEEDRLQILAMDGPEVWIRISGRGLKSVFERHEVNQ
jgi:hypothetical protein